MKNDRRWKSWRKQTYIKKSSKANEKSTEPKWRERKMKKKNQRMKIEKNWMEKIPTQIQGQKDFIFVENRVLNKNIKEKRKEIKSHWEEFAIWSQYG